jgi:hypothetical protein
MTNKTLTKTGIAKCIVFCLFLLKMITRTEMIPATRNETRIQERVSLTDKKDAADMKSFTSPAAMPFRK